MSPSTSPAPVSRSSSGSRRSWSRSSSSLLPSATRCRKATKTRAGSCTCKRGNCASCCLIPRADTIAIVAPSDFRVDGPTAEPARGDEHATRMSLAVLGDGIIATHPLPARGQIVVGRGADADVRIDHESVSRKHVRIHISDELELEDLGSSNGTRLRDAPVEARTRVKFEPGEVVELGSVMLVVQ